jgi:hypothetical protein
MFTDIEVGLRFDETHFTVSRELWRTGAWRLRPELGGVHVGEGLLGQSFQNWFHRLIGRPEEHLAYIDDSLHASVRLEVLRPFRPHENVTAGPWIELYDAFGFRRHLIAGGNFEWQARPKLAFIGYLAARQSHSDEPVLDRWFVGWGGAAEIGLRYGKMLTVSFSHNAMGTRDEHFHVRLRMRVRKGLEGPPVE